VYPPLPDTLGRSYTIEDIRVQTGTFNAHTRYFENRRVASIIARYLRADYQKDQR
jgi:hypothetical protein